MNLITKSSLLVLACTFMILSVVSNSSAQEVITIQAAKGGQYSILAYDDRANRYYHFNGVLSSDHHQINIPDGCASSVTVALGRATGTRNLYEKRDPYNPIYKVTKKSAVVLEIQFVGKGTGAVVPKAFGSVIMGGISSGFKRQPPQ